MKKLMIMTLLFLAVVVMASAQTTATPNKDASASLRENLLKLVRQADNAFMQRDQKTIEATLAENFIHVNPLGGVGRRASLQALPKWEVQVNESEGKTTYVIKQPEGRLTIEKSDFEWREYGDMILLVMKETITAEPKELNPVSPQRVSYLFVKTGDRWQIAGSQRTQIKSNDK